MTGAELIAAFRNDVRDEALPYAWTDAEILRWANEGHREAVRRGRLLIDSTTAAVCQAAITAGDPLVTLDERVLFVRRARIDSQVPALARRRVRTMDVEFPGWDSSTTRRTPRIFIPDYQSGKLRLHDIPVANATLLMTVVRLPLVDITTGSSPEIGDHLHEALLHWVKHRAYLKADEDSKDEELSVQFLELFEQEFGPKSPAYDERWVADNYDPDDGGLY